MPDEETLDPLFQRALAALDAGDVALLERLLAAHPRLVRDRLRKPGTWLAHQAGGALEGFFKAPFLLWFIAEDPARHDRMPPHIVASARAIIEAARQQAVPSLQEQVDYALRLVCWSTVARDGGVQLDLMSLLLAAGADRHGSALYDGRFGTNAEAAIYNGNDAAARFLLAQGAPVTLSAALCLGRWAGVDRLVRQADADEKADAFVLAALNGKAEALRRMLALGLSPGTVSRRNQPHAGSLHHAVWSGSLAAVKLLVEAGADLDARDTLYNGTPLIWAEYGESQSQGQRAERYREIAEFLRHSA